MSLPFDPDLVAEGLSLVDPETSEVLDCVTCGACCLEASDGRVLVSAADLVRWRREGRGELADGTVEGHFGERAFAATDDGACVHLDGTDGRAVCRIYDTRGETCREFQAGSWQCLEFRRKRRPRANAGG